MSDWPGSGWGSDPDAYHRRPGPGAALLVALGAAGFMALDGYVLPYVYRGFTSEGSGQLSTGFTLWTLIHRGEAASLGVGWVYIVVAGLAAAGLGALAELVLRPVHPWPRWICVVGFGLAVGGSCTGLIVGAAGSGEELSGVLSNPMITGLDKGFWLGLIAQAAGLTASISRLLEPPNVRHRRPPFERSPWGRPAPVPPPGFIPPMPDALVDYIRRGEIPPGYVPPSYGPAVYPSPGFMTPAYVAPGYRGGGGPGFGAASESASPPLPEVVESQMRALGRLVVSDGPRVSTLLVEPGTRLTVGRDAYAEIRVTDRNVSERHATIERRGLGWAIQDVDAVRVTRLVDAWGTHSIVRGETEIPAGQLQLGDVVITLFPVQPERPAAPPSDGSGS